MGLDLCIYQYSSKDVDLMIKASHRVWKTFMTLKSD